MTNVTESRTGKTTRRYDASHEDSSSRQRTTSSLSDDHNTQRDYQRGGSGALDKRREYAGEAMAGKQDYTHFTLTSGISVTSPSPQVYIFDLA